MSALFSDLCVFLFVFRLRCRLVPWCHGWYFAWVVWVRLSFPRDARISFFSAFLYLFGGDLDISVFQFCLIAVMSCLDVFISLACLPWSIAFAWYSCFLVPFFCISCVKYFPQSWSSFAAHISLSRFPSSWMSAKSFVLICSFLFGVFPPDGKCFV